MSLLTKDKDLQANTLINPTPKAKKTYIEVLRIIAAFFVIVNHTNSDIFVKYAEGGSATWFFSLAYFFISKISVPIFLMIMGGLLLCKVDDPKKLFQRIFRIFIVLIVFSIIYYIYFHRNAPQTMSIGDFFTNTFSKRQTNAFWYLYTYLGLLIMLPIFQNMAKHFSRKLILYLVAISVAVMGVVPMLPVFFDFNLNSYFTNTLFVPMVGLVFAGFYIERYMKISKSDFYLSVILFVCIITFEVLYTYNLWLENSTRYLLLDNRDFLTITLSAICVYIMFKYLNDTFSKREAMSKVICYIGSLTFGIYLLSDLAKYITKPYYTKMVAGDNSIILTTLLWQIVIFVACGIVTAILRLIPGVKKYL